VSTVVAVGLVWVGVSFAFGAWLAALSLTGRTIGHRVGEEGLPLLGDMRLTQAVPASGLREPAAASQIPPPCGGASYRPPSDGLNSP
jgi:hypothetical protein